MTPEEIAAWVEANLNKEIEFSTLDIFNNPSYKPSSIIDGTKYYNGRVIGNRGPRPGNKLILVALGPTIGWDPDLQIMHSYVHTSAEKPIHTCWWVNFEHILKSQEVDLKKFPHKCPRCTAPALVLFTSVECSANCAKLNKKAG